MAVRDLKHIEGNESKLDAYIARKALEDKKVRNASVCKVNRVDNTRSPLNKCISKKHRNMHNNDDKVMGID